MENLKLHVKLSAYTKGAIPTKLSDLENDMDFITDPNYIHTDNNLTDELVEAIEHSVRYDINQTLTEAEKARARANIGVTGDPEIQELKDKVEHLEEFEVEQLELNTAVDSRLTNVESEVSQLSSDLNNASESLQNQINDLEPRVSNLEDSVLNLEEDKLNKYQGLENAGKALSVGVDGYIETIEFPKTVEADNDTIIERQPDQKLEARALRRTGGGKITADDISDLQLDVATYKVSNNLEITNIKNVNNNQQNEINSVTERVNTLVGTGGYLTANNFGTATPSQSALTSYALSEIGITDYLEIWNGTKVKNTFDGNTWVLTNTQDTDPTIFEWTNQGIDFVGLATNSVAGIVKGSDDQFKINVDLLGEMSVNGLEEALENVIVKTDDITIRTNNEDKLEVISLKNFIEIEEGL